MRWLKLFLKKGKKKKNVKSWSEIMKEDSFYIPRSSIHPITFRNYDK